MSDSYTVFGDPIEHSLSPLIHAEFARLCTQDMVYSKTRSSKDDFVGDVETFKLAGGKGANVTVPLKELAFAYADNLTPRAQNAQAVNTLCFTPDGVLGDNTDGIGLITDLTCNIGLKLAGISVLLLGAGGAARGIIQPLLDSGIRHLTIANRTESKAIDLCRLFRLATPSALKDINGKYDLIINATAASLTGKSLSLNSGIITDNCVCYDLMYAKEPTTFMLWSQENGAAQTIDGLGMLVEQAAEAFYVWRGVRPVTAGVLAGLRSL